MKRGVDSEKRAFKEALDNGSMSRRKLSWSEPWDWDRAKQGVRAASRAMPFRRFAVYGLAIPLAAATSAWWSLPTPISSRSPPHWDAERKIAPLTIISPW